jgi:DNA-binding TFAR19-related protein (PDSD5 family)
MRKSFIFDFAMRPHQYDDQRGFNDMAVKSNDVFNKMMTSEMLAESHRRADELMSDWSALRAELPSEVRERLDNVRSVRRIGR